MNDELETEKTLSNEKIAQVSDKTINLSEFSSSDSKKDFLATLSTKFLLVLTAILLFGITLIFVSIIVENEGKGLDKHTIIVLVKEIGILLFAVVTTTLVHERFLRSHSLKETQDLLQEQLSNVIEKTLPDKIQKVISSQLPQKYANIKNSGIIDAYVDLDTPRVMNKIRNLGKNSEVFLLKIWLTGIDDWGYTITEAVRKGCVFKIIILHPDQTEVFEKRGKFLSFHNSDSMRNKIIETITRLKLIIDSIKNDKEISLDRKNNLQVKLHKDFVTASIIGYDSDIMVGFYLHDSIAENNVQIKISGKNTKFYKAFKEHFDTQWGSRDNINLEDYQM